MASPQDFSLLPHRSRLSSGIVSFENDLLDFSSSVNALGIPVNVQKTLSQTESILQYYPDPTCAELRRKIASEDGVPQDWILCGNGSMDLIYLLPSLLKRPIAFQWAPTFLGYESAFWASEGEMLSASFSKEGDVWRLPNDLKVPEQAQMIFISNPNNPTGHLLSLETLMDLADQCERRKVYLIIDEAFIEFAGSSQSLSFLKVIMNYRYVGVLRSFTKIFTLPGLRLGYLVGDPEWIMQLQKRQAPWSVNGLAEVIGQELVGQASFFEFTRTEISRARTDFIKQLRIFPEIQVFDSCTNFLLIKVKDTAERLIEFKEFLKQKRIRVRSCEEYRYLGSGDYFRLTVRQPEENQQLTTALQSFF